MPKSRIRKKKVYTAPPSVAPTPESTQKASPRWLPGAALGCACFGLVWLVTYYMTQGAYPIPQIQEWNIAVGFAGIVAALAIFTQWK